MSVKVTTEGIEDLKKELIKIGNKANDIIDDALLKAVKPIHSEMQKRINVSDLSKKHLKDNIPIKKEETENGVHSVSIGWTKQDNSEFFYSKYLEWGTTKMKARPFMQPAIDKKEKEAFNILIDTITRELEL